MSNRLCPHESETVTAMRSDVWSDTLRAHTAACPQCTDALWIGRLMNESAGRTTAALEPPVSYRVLWLKAQFMRRQEQLSRLDRLMFLGALATSAVALAGIALWKWSDVQRWLASLSGGPVAGLPIYLLVGCAALVWFLTEEIFVNDR